MEPWQVIATTLFFVLLILLTVLLATRRGPEQEAATAVEIARIFERNIAQSATVGILGFLLILFSIVSLFEYLTAKTVEQQIAALLLWIGNSLFWGIFLLSNLIAKGRISIIYRDAKPADHEPLAPD